MHPGLLSQPSGPLKGAGDSPPRQKGKRVVTDGDKPGRGGERTKAKLVYFTPDEWAQVEAAAQATGRPAGRFIREAALGARPRSRPGAASAQAIAELGRIGNNLNQLARVANTAGVERVEAAATAALAELLEAVKRL